MSERGADAWGVFDGYEDAAGEWRETPVESRRAMVAAMGGGQLDAPPDASPVRFVRPDSDRSLPSPAQLRLEDGTELDVIDQLPPDLPLGYHRLVDADGGLTELIATPGRCPDPPVSAWGWAVQLYAARSTDSWGIGDLGDLRRLAAWSHGLGARVLLVNPLGAATPISPREASPYLPTTRRFVDPLYLRIEDVAGAGEAGIDLDASAAEARALNTSRRIDRDAVARLKLAALEQLWRRFPGDREFDRFRAAQGEPLATFATFCVLAEHHGSGWRDWPAEHQRPDGSAVARVATEEADRVDFHAWLQWLADGQLAAASAHLQVMHDLPIGVDPAGADAWAWQDVLASNVTVGAPPDEFNTQGQDWALPPFVPWRLRAAGYRPFVETIRASLRHGGALRIDHVMGLFRLFWIPAGAGPQAGGYVRYPAADLLDIVALESHRAGAFVVGEDLGTVQDEVREELARRRVLTYKLLWFEPDHPRSWPAASMGSVTTHDLPTIAGQWTGADLREQEDLDLRPNVDATLDVTRRLRDWTSVSQGTPIHEVIVATHTLLGGAPSSVVVATLEDALGVTERPNVPGTTNEQRPNWSLALPKSLDQIEDDPMVAAVAAALRER